MGPIEIKMFFVGNLNPADIIAFKNASYCVLPKHATSPVDAISTPRRGSDPLNRKNENVGTLQATYSQSIG